MQKDYYETLTLDNKASQKQIKEAYRKLALEYHPDRNRDPLAAAKMKEINEAYAVLSDPAKRKEYDTLQQTYGAAASSRFRQSYSQEDIFRGSDIRHVYEEISRVFGLRGFEEIFREFYGPGYRTFEFRRPGFSARAFTFRHPFGTGSGGEPSFPSLPGGALGRALKFLLKKKWGIEWPERGKDLNDRITIPPSLARTGGKIGFVFRQKGKELLVTIPPRIRDGQRIRLKGMGKSGKGGGEPGDLYLRIRVKNSLLQKALDVARRLVGR